MLKLGKNTRPPSRTIASLTGPRWWSCPSPGALGSALAAVAGRWPVAEKKSSKILPLHACVPEIRNSEIKNFQNWDKTTTATFTLTSRRDKSAYTPGPEITGINVFGELRGCLQFKPQIRSFESKELEDNNENTFRNRNTKTGKNKIKLECNA